MDKPLTHRIQIRVKRRFRESVFSGLFRPSVRHNRPHTTPVVPLIHQSTQHERCSYRTRLEDHESSDADGEHDSQLNGEDTPLRRYPARYGDTLTAWEQHDLLAGSTTTLTDTEHNPENGLCRTRTSMSSWTKVEQQDAQDDSQPRSSMSTGRGRTISTGSWTDVDSGDAETSSMFRSYECATPGELRVIDSYWEDRSDSRRGDISSRRASVSSSVQSGNDLHSTAAAIWVATPMRSSSVPLPDDARSAASLSQQETSDPEPSPKKGEPYQPPSVAPLAAEKQKRGSPASSSLAESWERWVNASDVASSPSSASAQNEDRLWDEYMQERSRSAPTAEDASFAHSSSDDEPTALCNLDEYITPWNPARPPVWPPRRRELEPEGEPQLSRREERELGYASSTSEGTDDGDGPARCTVCRADLTRPASEPCSAGRRKHTAPDSVPNTVGQSLWRAVCNAGNSLQYEKYLPRRGG